MFFFLNLCILLVWSPVHHDDTFFRHPLALSFWLKGVYNNSLTVKKQAIFCFFLGPDLETHRPVGSLLFGWVVGWSIRFGLR